MEGGRGGRKAKLTSQISVLDPAKIRDLIKLREDHNTFRHDSSLAGLTVDAVLGGDQRRSSTTSQVENNQQCRTLLDIICSDEDNSGAAYRGLVAQSNKKNGKKNSKKSIKERLRLLRSSRPVPTCDIPISKGRNTVNISNPFPPPQAPKRSISTKISSSTAFPAGIDAKQVADPIVPCNINEEDDDDDDHDKHEEQQQQPMLKNEEEEQVVYPIVLCNVNEADDDDKHEEQQQPMLKNEEEEEGEDDDDDNPKLKNDIDEPVTSKDDDELEEEEEEEHQPISKNQEEEEEEEEHQLISKNQEEEEEEEEDDDKSEEEEENDVFGNATSRLLISELREVDDEINGSNKAFISAMKEDDDDDDDDDDDEEEEPVKQVSLMALLEESMGAGDSEDEEEDALDIEDDVEVGGQYVCCVCMVRHNKGTCFSHCGHSFCRLCCKELFVGKGNCPRCNGYVMEIVEIF